MANTNNTEVRLRVRRTSIGECVRTTVELATTCDLTALADLPVEVSSTAPDRLRRARELAQRLRLGPVPEAP